MMEPNDLRAAARDLLASRTGDAESRVVAEQSERLPDGRVVRRYWAVSAARPNGVESAVLDEEGQEHDLTGLEVAAGRALFAPAAAERPAPELRAAPVTVEPPANDLVLRECAELAERVTVTVPVSGVKPKADVYLLADTTGSMSPVLAAVQAGIDSILTALDPSVFDVAFGVGNYRDFPLGSDPAAYAFQPQLAPTTDLVNVRNAVLTWVAAGGGDGSEAQLFALDRLAADPAIGWRPGARRIVAWFGDAPGHDPVCAAISGAAADVTEASATAALRAAEIIVVAVSTITGFYPAGLDDDPAADAGNYTVCTIGGSPGQATRITAATGGAHVAGNAADIIPTLAELIRKAVTSTGNVRLVPSASIAGFVRGVSPAGGYGPLPGDTEHRLAFDVAWAGTVGCAEDPQVFSGSLDVVADGAVVAAKPVRIAVPACRYHHVVEVLCGAQGPVGERECATVASGRYATAVTLYNPGPCPVVVEKRFAPVLLNGKAVGREPRAVAAKPFARIRLEPGEATMDDCCALGEAVRLDPGTPTLGVLDLVTDRALVVTAVYTTGARKDQSGAPGVHTRTVTPRRA
ncbi:hypothetical protein DP939_14730 [Spongiactinospora rosea]|uniref:VWFA domain-containing protein n=1 Tax=Spongiactinospora rosea TaxID=2248750 RepID=A0A366LYZ9_9ACTN|nr:vWA domain-containing protein [Spongiactinospora rosea]RBQ19198.1 hypothetical protein DP939_14730 [Spongiactinospora rosea]